MAKKTTDPFMRDLWESLVADKLGPAGHETSWAETPVRIRNRFIRQVRQVMQSGAAFGASAAVDVEPRKVAAPTGKGTAGKKATAKARAQNELMLPLMSHVSGERPAKKKK
jgi:hypothetical protein